MKKNGTQIESWGPFAEGKNDYFNNPVLKEIGASHGKSAAQVALRFLIQIGVVVIPKSTHVERMEENFNVFDFELTADEMTKVEELDGGESLFFSHYDPKTVEWFMTFVMKRIVMALLMAAMVISLTACGGNAGQNGNSSSDALDREQSPAHVEESASAQPETNDTFESSEDAAVTGTDGTEAADSQGVQEEEGSKVLVAYFSATGTTKRVAEIIVGNMDADIYEIVPQEPYTDADLDWHDDSSRSTIEMNDRSCRPEINGAVEDMEQYDIVFIGYAGGIIGLN